MSLDPVADLRPEYVRGGLRRVDEILAALDRLDADQGDDAALESLRRAVHQLTGSGTTYGFPDVTRTGGLIEAGCAAPPQSRNEVAGWRELAHDMRRALLAGPRGDQGGVEPIAPAAADRPRVLSVEDDPDYAAYIRALLGSAGYVVRTCDDPARLDEEIAAFRPDLVLMDVLLPGVTGYELGRRLRQQGAHATLPILVLTTQHHVQARLDGLAAGADDYLVKSDAPALLLATIATRVERARLLNDLVERDGLTQLFTHTALRSRIEAIVSERRRDPGRGTALAMIDVDHFKAVNDRYGHAVGDSVLSALAGLLRRRLRASDVVGRYGGEEFGVVFQGTSVSDADRLLSALGAEFGALEHQAAAAQRFTVTFSAGVTALDRGMGAHEWIEKADAALYEAKAAGRNRVTIR